MVHWQARLDSYAPGPSDMLPVAPDKIVLPEHAILGVSMGTEVSAITIGLGVPPGAEDGAYSASNPAAFAEPSDENVTYSWPLGDVTDITDLEPVIVSTSGADDEVPAYILTKS